MKDEKAPACAVQVGDVWVSKGGRSRVQVTAMTTGKWGVVKWRMLNATPGSIRETGDCGLARFPRGRTLVERDGKKVA